jgi:DNA-binding NarL/FixJ family response regulator
MNYDKINTTPGPRVSRAFQKETLSQSQHAIAQRSRYLSSDEEAEKMSATWKRSRNKAKAKIVIEKATARKGNRKYGIDVKVRHHIAKGRTVTDIAIREGLMVSAVQEAYDRIMKEGGV